MVDIRQRLAQAQKLTADARVSLERLLGEVEALRADVTALSGGEGAFAGEKTHGTGGAVPPADAAPADADAPDLLFDESDSEGDQT